MKQYKENNEEQIKERAKYTTVCDCCGSVGNTYQLSRHKATTECTIIADSKNNIF